MTADAICCQAERATLIGERGGHCLLALKRNQPAMLAQVETFFADPPPDALARHATADAKDRGSQFMSTASTGALAAAGIRISMDGRERWTDNVFIERLWQSLNHEDVHLKSYADGREARAGIDS